MPTPTLTRTTSGLILNEDFSGDQSGYTNTGGFAGQTLVFKVADLIPLESATASGASYSTTTLKQPRINTVQVAGTQLQLPGNAPIYGGDTLAYSAGSSGGVTNASFNHSGQRSRMR